MTSSVTSPIDSPRPLSYKLPIVTYPLAPLVSEIFDLKVADKQTDRQTDGQNSTLSDYKGRLKLSAREPIRQNDSWLRRATVTAACLLHKITIIFCHYPKYY